MKSEIVKRKVDKIYNLLVEAKDLQCDIVSNDGKLMTTKEREEIVKIWNLLDEVAKITHELRC